MYNIYILIIINFPERSFGASSQDGSMPYSSRGGLARQKTLEVRFVSPRQTQWQHTKRRLRTICKLLLQP